MKRYWRQLTGSLLLSAICAAPSAGAPEQLSDDELAVIAGRDGISVAVHLKLDTSVLMGFADGQQTSYLALQGVGGEADAWSLRASLEQLPGDSGSYLSIGLPRFVGFRNFGVGSAGVVANPTAMVPANSSLGQLQLNGSGAMTGNLLLWAD